MNLSAPLVGSTYRENTMSDLKILMLVLSCLLASCCGLDENRKSKEAMLRFARAVEAEHAHLISHELIAKALEDARQRGDRDACLEHAEMLVLVEVGFPVIIAAIDQWAEGQEVDVPDMPPVDLEAMCEVP